MTERRVIKNPKAQTSVRTQATKADANAKRGKKQYRGKNRPKHYVSSSQFDIDKLQIGIGFYKRKTDQLMMVFTFNYEYAQGIVERLNIIHENSRIYASKVLDIYRKYNGMGPDYLEYVNNIAAPIRYDNPHDSMLKSASDLIKSKFTEFLISLKNQDFEILNETYCQTEPDVNGKKQYIKQLHKWLAGMSDREIAQLFEKRNYNSDSDSDSDSEDNEPQRKYDPAIFQMRPKITTRTNITKLGSKKSGYQNEELTMKSFFEEMEKSYGMNRKESDYYLQANMIVNISSHCIIRGYDGPQINFRPDCSDFEYRLNKASCKRVIKREKLEEPGVLRSLSV